MSTETHKNDFYQFPLDSDETRSVRLLFDRSVQFDAVCVFFFLLRFIAFFCCVFLLRFFVAFFFLLRFSVAFLPFIVLFVYLFNTCSIFTDGAHFMRLRNLSAWRS